MNVVLPHNFEPRSYQQRVWAAFNKGIKRFDLVWHRRSGKDTNAVNLTIPQMMGRTGVYYHILPTYQQGKRIIWDGIGRYGLRFTDFFPPELLHAEPNNSEMKIVLKSPRNLGPGSIYQVVGADDLRAINKLVGTNPVGLIFSEWSLMNPIVWDLFRPVLLENGGWAFFIYTPRGKNHAFDQHERARVSPDWYTEVLSIEDTRRDASAFTLLRAGCEPEEIPAEDGLPIITREMYEKEISDGMQEPIAKQEYYCSFAAGMLGSYYADIIERMELERKITDVPHDPSRMVYTFWDIGVDNATAIIFVQHDPRVKAFYVIDYIEDTGAGSDFYAKEIRDRPYNYARHNLPHDGAHTDWSSTMTREAALKSNGLRNVMTHPPSNPGDGIDAVRRVLPMCYIDKTKCARLVNAMRSYRREWNDERKCFSQKPLHDWSSDGADAFRLFATTFRPVEAELGYQYPSIGEGRRQAAIGFNPITVQRDAKISVGVRSFDRRR